MSTKWSNRYLREIVVQWFDRSQDTVNWPSIFDRFIFLWIAFDAWGSNESGQINDKMIDWVKTSRMKVIFRVLRNDLEPLLLVLSKKGDIPNHLGRKRVGLHDPHDFHKLMEVLYQIRNNLFHGHKSPGDNEDIEIVTLAYGILSPLMKPLVEEL